MRYFYFNFYFIAFLEKTSILENKKIVAIFVLAFILTQIHDFKNCLARGLSFCFRVFGLSAFNLLKILKMYYFSCS